MRLQLLAGLSSITQIAPAAKTFQFSTHRYSKYGGGIERQNVRHHFSRFDRHYRQRMATETNSQLLDIQDRTGMHVYDNVFKAQFGLGVAGSKMALEKAKIQPALDWQPLARISSREVLNELVSSSSNQAAAGENLPVALWFHLQTHSPKRDSQSSMRHQIVGWGEFDYDWQHEGCSYDYDDLDQELPSIFAGSSAAAHSERNALLIALSEVLKLSKCSDSAHHDKL
eukprot:TRINITY_DN96275_c0_g1_i1.p1 TRINITY_DN96275_c0_g1~~TRINITY_DN96275_c0_g1_i1.p1  ORF type:complete len:227 (-),score=25.19 TRINITY_DN96275_c0_g1_i1:937-1617(-)